MRFTLEIPEAEYKRYSQYYKPYIVSMEQDTVSGENPPPTESEVQAILDSWKK